jgi:hypothetical protein
MVSAPSVLGIGDEKYVKLISNTETCLDDCATVYEITAVEKDINLDLINSWWTFGLLSWKEKWWSFQDKKNMNLRPAEEVTGLKDWQLWIEDTRTVNKPFSVTTQTCENQTLNNTVFNICTDTTSIQNRYTEEKYWREFVSSDKIIPARTSAKFKITGQLEPNKYIDNALTLSVDDIEQTYDQWTWWNSTWPYKRAITTTAVGSALTNIPILINSSFDLGGPAAKNYVWGLAPAATGTTYLYYENNSNYTFIDGTEAYKLPMEVEQGNTTNQYNVTQLWNLTGAQGVWHLTNASDSSEYNRIFTITSLANESSCPFGKCFSKTAAAGVAKRADFSIGKDNQSYTVSFWAKGDRTSTLGDYMNFFSWADGSSTAALYCYVSGYANNQLRCSQIFSSTAYHWTADISAYAITSWRFYTIVSDFDHGPAAMQLYVDGTLLTNLTQGVGVVRTGGTQDLSVFNKWATGDAEDFDGDMDEVRIFSGAKGSDWVHQQFHNGSSVFGAQEAPPVANTFTMKASFVTPTFELNATHVNVSLINSAKSFSNASVNLTWGSAFYNGNNITFIKYNATQWEVHLNVTPPLEEINNTQHSMIWRAWINDTDMSEESSSTAPESQYVMWATFPNATNAETFTYETNNQTFNTTVIKYPTSTKPTWGVTTNYSNNAPFTTSITYNNTYSETWQEYLDLPLELENHTAKAIFSKLFVAYDGRNYSRNATTSQDIFWAYAPLTIAAMNNTFETDANIINATMLRIPTSNFAGVTVQFNISQNDTAYQLINTDATYEFWNLTLISPLVTKNKTWYNVTSNLGLTYAGTTMNRTGANTTQYIMWATNLVSNDVQSIVFETMPETINTTLIKTGVTYPATTSVNLSWNNTDYGATSLLSSTASSETWQMIHTPPLERINETIKNIIVSLFLTFNGTTINRSTTNLSQNVVWATSISSNAALANVYETQPQTINTTIIKALNTYTTTMVNLSWNNTNYGASSLISNETTSEIWQQGIFAPLERINETIKDIIYSLFVTYNGTTLNRSTVNTTQTVQWGTFISSDAVLPNVYETATETVNTTVVRLNPTILSSTQVNLTWNSTDYAPTRIYNASLQEIWQANITPDFIAANGTTMQVLSYLLLTYNGTTMNRTGFNTSQNVVWAYSLGNTSFEALPFETNTQTINTTILKSGSAAAATTLVNISWGDDANITSTLISNTSTAEVWQRTISIPLVTTNMTNKQIIPLFHLTYAGNLVNRSGTNNSQNIMWAYFPTTVNVSTYDAIETEDVQANATVIAYKTGALLALNFTHGGTQYTSTLISNVSNTLKYSRTYTSGLIADGAGSNSSVVANSTLAVTYGGTTLYRNSINFQNITTWKMILTQCNGGTVSNNITLHYSLFDENIPANDVMSKFEEYYEVWKVAGMSRVYSWMRINRTNASVCLFPYAADTKLNVHQIIAYGDQITWTKRLYESTNIVNLTQQNVSLYLLNLSDTTTTFVAITVENVNGIIQPGKLTQVWRRYSADNSMKLISQDITNSDGKIGAYMRLVDTYYQFTVYDDALKTNLMYNSSLNKIFANTLTLRIGQAAPTVWLLTNSLSHTTHNLTYTNDTKTFTFNWDITKLGNTSFNVNNLCLELKYNENYTSNWTRYSVTCDTSLTGTLTDIIDPSVSERWIAQSFINISASPVYYHIFDIVGVNIENGLGGLGLLFTFIIVLAVIAGGLWNPAVSICMGVGTMLILTIVGIMPITIATIVSMFIAGLIVIIYLKT